jgi:hypothetical protein
MFCLTGKGSFSGWSTWENLLFLATSDNRKDRRNSLLFHPSQTIWGVFVSSDKLATVELYNRLRTGRYKFHSFSIVAMSSSIYVNAAPIVEPAIQVVPP